MAPPLAENIAHDLSLRLHRIPSRDLKPDIAKEARVQVSGRLDRVGMSDIDVRVCLQEGARQIYVPAKAEAYVSLDAELAKGIHMSRLYLSLEEHLDEKTLSSETLLAVLDSFLDSHKDLSKSASVKIKFDYLTKRGSLKSDNTGWRSYPVTMAASLIAGKLRFEVGTEIAYSSTCPCSAALARQLIQEQFKKDFGSRELLSPDEVFKWIGTEEAICATPHSQRSYAHVKVAFDDAKTNVDFRDLIDAIENSLQTAVQAAVKREDEQEFALRNGRNLMFCEDAARRMKSVLESDTRLSDYYVKAQHVESLHPHDAVSIVTKGVQGGFQSN